MLQLLDSLNVELGRLNKKHQLKVMLAEREDPLQAGKIDNVRLIMYF